MIDILGEKFITDKEASSRYGYSKSWFQYRRSKNLYPKFSKISGNGRVFYNLEETDNWFKEQLSIKSNLNN